ncbi:MAG: LemA family protein [Ferruginibacter sp.]
MSKRIFIKIISLFVFSLILFSFQKTFSQDIPKPIKTKWENLKSLLQRRIDIVTTLSSQYSAAFDIEKLKFAKKAALNLNKYLVSLNHPDSTSVSLTNLKNANLTNTLLVALATLKNKSAFKEQDKAESIIVELEGVENRIVLARKEYNDSCKENNRTDLIFNVKSSKAPSIQF